VTSSNLKHLFIDEKRVTFDRRDDSVTLFPDRDFRFIAAERIGYASGAGRSWTATAPDGTERHCEGRKDAALWLIEQTRDQRSARKSSQAARRTSEVKATDEVMALIQRFRADYPRPRPIGGDPNEAVFFVFHPAELRDLLLDFQRVGRGPAVPYDL
jgi:hypothetical protein